MRYILIIFLSTLLYAQKDFYYGFINNNGEQLSYKKKKNLKDGYDTLARIRELMVNGKISEAFDMINVFLFHSNKEKLLESDAILLFAELSYKKKFKRFIINGAKVLEKAINNSKISEVDLPKAYMLLIDLKLAQNKTKDAEYFAKTIIETFDDEYLKTMGKIYLAKVHTHKGEYKRSERILYKILIETTDLKIATVVADNLYKVYLKSKQRDKAYKLLKKVLTTNMRYYTQDSYRALEAIDRLVKAKMFDFAEGILKALIKEAKKPDNIEDFKFRLANLYMDMYDRTPKYLELARVIYEDLLTHYPEGAHIDKVKMYLDEILMRTNKIEPVAVAQRYKDSESMKQKALLQEVMIFKSYKKYRYLLDNWKAYKQISPAIARRFGYKSMNDIYDDINNLMIKKLLSQGKCEELQQALRTARKDSLMKLIKDDKSKFDFFECMIEAPYNRAYALIRKTFRNTRDGNIYLYLERMAYALGKYKEAYEYSINIDIANDPKIFKKEFLHRFMTFQKQNNDVIMNKFFYYATLHPEYIKANEDNPQIMDFYHQYYFYLIANNRYQKAYEILQKLYDKQKEFKAYVYTPFVDFELEKIVKDKNDLDKAISYLLDALEHAKNIRMTQLKGKDIYRLRGDDLAHIYYELSKLYKEKGDIPTYHTYIKKCKSLDNAKDSLYKKMCDKI